MKDLLKDKPSMKLEEFIAQYSNELDHKRILYVVQANLDEGKVTKFGIGGANSGNSIKRLQEYIAMYGKNEIRNKCKGVIIFYCGVTEYNRLIESTKSQVHLVEKELKNRLKSTTIEGRGIERTKKQPNEVIHEIKNIVKGIKETPIPITKVTRPTTQKYRNDTRNAIDTQQKSNPIRRSTRIK